MNIRSAKAKGRRLASRVKDMLHSFAPDLQVGDIEVTSSSVTGEDLKLSPAAKDTYPLIFECKNQEKLNIWDALKQAKTHHDDWVKLNALPLYPCVVFSRNHEDTYVALKFEDFLKLIT